MRGSSIKKNLMFLYLGLLFSLSACGINLQTGPSPNIDGMCFEESMLPEVHSC